MAIDKNRFSPQLKGSIADETTGEFHKSIKRLGRAIETEDPFYLRSDGINQFLRPDGTSIYFRY